MGQHYKQLDATADTLREHLSILQEQDGVSAAHMHDDSGQYQTRAKNQIRRRSMAESKLNSKCEVRAASQYSLSN